MHNDCSSIIIYDNQNTKLLTTLYMVKKFMVTLTLDAPFYRWGDVCLWIYWTPNIPVDMFMASTWAWENNVQIYKLLRQ